MDKQEMKQRIERRRNDLDAKMWENTDSYLDKTGNKYLDKYLGDEISTNTAVINELNDILKMFE